MKTVKPKTDNFYKLLIKEIRKNLLNRHKDNYDFYKYGQKKQLKIQLKKRVSHLFYALLYLTKVSRLNKILSDENSKNLLVKIHSYKILGYKKYKLPLNKPDYWDGIAELKRIESKDDKLFTNSKKDHYLPKFDLNEVGIPIEMYGNVSGIYHTMKVKQYEYEQENIHIKAEKDDIVLDCGACFGDTSLFFAHNLETDGHVYCFEFVLGNIKVFEQNLNLNPALKRKITLIPNPLAEKTGKELFYFDNGAASKVSNKKFPNSQKTETITIDDAVEKYHLQKVDFIKMDIEGSELPALKGGINTIKKYRPKLAISIYHSMSDFVNIAQYLKSLDLGYDFYLKHGTIHYEESVLFAQISK